MKFYFEEEKLWQKKKQSVLKRINQSGLPLVLFGKAPVVDHSFLDRVQVPISYICDNNPDKWGSTLWGRKVISPDRLPDIYTAYNVLILVPFEHQIVPQLQELSVPPAEIFRLDLYFEENETAEYFRRMKADLEEIYHQLADQASKDTFEAVIRYRINRDPSILTSVALPRASQYFPDILGGVPLFSEEETFVDAGAFIGDTVESFYRTVNGKYRAAYAFEAEIQNYERLVANTKSYPNVHCRQMAISDQAGEIRFMSDDSGSKADQSGEEVVPTDTLDRLLGDTHITYLKMDVEGMECAALSGARKLIQKHRPKLAICTYHSNSDMIQVPKLILELAPTYQLYFRHYTTALVETVCYAI